MSIAKPTASELKEWDKVLQQEHLGMDRARNTDRLNYGFEDGNSLVRTWEDVKIYTSVKRKAIDGVCVVCGGPFSLRADAKACSRRCRRRLQIRLRQQRFSRIRGL